MKQNLKKNLLNRFCCSLIVNGNKSLAYKVLLESGRLLRQNYNITSSSTIYEKSVSLSLEILRNLARFISSRRGKGDDQERMFLHLPTLPCVRDTSMRKPITEGEKRDVSGNLKFALQIENLSDQSSEMRDSLGWRKLSNNLEKDLPVHNEKEKGRWLNQTRHSKINLSQKANDLLFACAPRKRSFFEGHSMFSLSTICVDCVDTVRPILETRKVRKGRITYKVPKVSSLFRQEGKAISMLIENAIALKKKGLKQQKEKDTINWSFPYPSLKRDHAVFDDHTVPYDKTCTKKAESTYNPFITRKVLPFTEQQRKNTYRGIGVTASSFRQEIENESGKSGSILKNSKRANFMRSQSLFSPKRTDNLFVKAEALKKAFPSFTSDRAFTKKMIQGNDPLQQESFTNQRFGVTNSLERENGEGKQMAFVKRKTLFTLFPFQSTKKLFFSEKTQNKTFIDSGLTSYAQGFLVQNFSPSKRSSLDFLREVALERVGVFTAEKITTQKDKALLFETPKQSLHAADIMTLEASNCKNLRQSRTLLKNTHNLTPLNENGSSISSYSFDKQTFSTKQKESITRKQGNGIAFLPLSSSMTCVRTQADAVDTTFDEVTCNMALTIPGATIKASSLTIIQKATISYCLALCFLDCLNKRGDSVEKKKQLHKLALQNRAYTHFKWW